MYYLYGYRNGNPPPAPAWNRDTCKDVGNRPVPKIAKGWMGWDYYEAHMRAVDKATARPALDQREARRRRYLKREAMKASEQAVKKRGKTRDRTDDASEHSIAWSKGQFIELGSKGRPGAPIGKDGK